MQSGMMLKIIIYAYTYAYLCARNTKKGKRNDVEKQPVQPPAASGSPPLSTPRFQPRTTPPSQTRSQPRSTPPTRPSGTRGHWSPASHRAITRLLEARKQRNLANNWVVQNSEALFGNSAGNGNDGERPQTDPVVAEAHVNDINQTGKFSICRA